jgi:predicted aminopeptidase
MNRFLTIASTLLCSAMLGGCAQLGYYAQAMHGQMSLLSSAKPIDTWLADPSTSTTLKVQLTRTREIRAFAATTLGLPDNGSYKSYAELQRPYVMWNVVATPELSLKPVQWCFPIAGCVDYRGYYQKGDAEQFAESLARQAYDVRVSGVPAYSTLGWFNDPILSSFINLPEAELARMVFHELAHQVAYAPGDSPFNEAFATAVEDIGVSLWLEAQGDAMMREQYRVHRQRKQDFLELLSRYRLQLDAVFEGHESIADKRLRKTQLFAQMKQDYEVMKTSLWGGYAGYDRWFHEPMSNAHFALVSTYQDLVPAFQNIYATSESLRHFYDRVKALAKLKKAQRRSALESMQPAAQPVIPEHHQQTVAVQ